MKVIKKKKGFKSLLFLLVSGVLIFLVFFFFNNFKTIQVKADSGDNVSGWAWSENIGWISFNNTSDGAIANYGVHIDSNGIFSGYAWSENIGWISFNQADLPGCPSGTCRAEVDLLSHDLEVSGWGRALAYGDGWDGWISLRGSNYGVNIDKITQQFEGWAWGDLVVGWISFNCNNPETLPNVCSGSDYKVKTSFSFNWPPYKPQPVGEGETWNHCWVSPQVALGTSISFDWIYSDSDGDPQQSYEIWVDGDSSFSGSKFNHIVNASAYSYILNLNHDEEGDWLSKLAWSNTYWWKVRVKDTGSGKWSEWSDPNSFTMNSHANPYPDFILVPSSPSAGEIVQLIAVDGLNQSVCYDSSDTEISCSGETFLWTLPLGVEFASTSIASTENPQIRFTDSGDYKIILKIKDAAGFCTKPYQIQAALPLPEWEEVSP
jgi:hypothetical protein